MGCPGVVKIESDSLPKRVRCFGAIEATCVVDVNRDDEDVLTFASDEHTGVGVQLYEQAAAPA
ncbi:MAG: hypothetical protein SGPRY_005674 [Prymnesium sp.]